MKLSTTSGVATITFDNGQTFNTTSAVPILVPYESVSASDKSFALSTIKLLSAIESWGFAMDHRLPDYLHDQLSEIVDKLTDEVLK